jgi:RND family efflux transporter MFP subunit
LIASISAFAEETISFSQDEIANIGIELGPVKLVYQTLTKQLPAEVSIPNKSQRVISAAQDGVVEILFVAEGDNVVAGQPLAQLNSPQLLQSQNDYLQALSRLAQANREMKRDKNLFEEGIIAERRYRQSLSTSQQVTIEVGMYKKALELAGMDSTAIANLNKTRALNSHLTVVAKNAGVVMKQFATAGQRLTAADPIYQVAELSTLWLEIHVPLDIAKQVQPNDEIKICEQGIGGHVIAVGRAVHAADQGVLVRAEISENTQQLTPGEFVQACFVQQTGVAQFEMPRSAIFRNEGRSAVFVKSEAGFSSQVVEVVAENGDKVVVTGNLSAQQEVVIKGTATVKAAWLGMGGE